jgi:hypothetical protein
LSSLCGIAYNDALSSAHCSESGEIVFHAPFALGVSTPGVVLCIDDASRPGRIANEETERMMVANWPLAREVNRSLVDMAEFASECCGVPVGQMWRVFKSVARQCDEPRWVHGDPMTSSASFDALFDQAAPLRGNEDPNQGELVWSRTSALTPLVCTLVRLHGPVATLGIVENEDLDRLKRRNELGQRLRQFHLYLTTDDLAIRLEALIDYLTQNRASLLVTGFPATWFMSWPAPLAVNLYPVRRPQNLLDDLLTRRRTPEASYPFIIPRPPLLWCCPDTQAISKTSTGHHARASQCRAGTVPCGSDEAPLLFCHEADEVRRLEDGRPALFALKLRLLKRLLQALQRRSTAGLWDDCLNVLTENLLANEADFYLTLDHHRGAELPESGDIARFNVEEQLPGGLTELFELIGYVEKELTIGTMDRTKRALDRVIDPDEEDPYLTAIGTARRDQIDNALDGFEERNVAEAAYWQAYQERVNAALQNDFYEEPVSRTRVKRPYAATFEARLALLATWFRDQLEQTGTLPELQLSQPEPVSANRFRRVGKAWDLAFDGLEIPFPDIKGMCHIRYLLQRPGQPVHVLELVRAAEGTITATDTPDREATAAVLAEIGASGVGFGDAGPLVDKGAIQALWQRKKEIDQEIAEADELGDWDSAETLREEKDWIVK